MMNFLAHRRRKEENSRMGHLGMPELLGIIALVLLIFGAKKVPEIFRSLGSGVNEFKKGLKEGAAEPASPDDKSTETKK